MEKLDSATLKTRLMKLYERKVKMYKDARDGAEANIQYGIVLGVVSTMSEFGLITNDDFDNLTEI